VLIIYDPFFALFMHHMSHHSEGDLPRIVLWGASVGALVYSTILAGLVTLLSGSQQNHGTRMCNNWPGRGDEHQFIYRTSPAPRQ